VAKRIELEFKDGVVFGAELFEDATPLTTQMFWDALPFTQELKHASYSGQALYAHLPIKVGKVENPYVLGCETGDLGMRTCRSRWVRSRTPMYSGARLGT